MRYAHSQQKVHLPLLSGLLKILSHPSSFTRTATGFSKTFPGIVPHLLTLTSNFRVPFYRDIILAMGICSVSKESCSNILKGGPGQSITIVVGGAAESLSAHPGTALIAFVVPPPQIPTSKFSLVNIRLMSPVGQAHSLSYMWQTALLGTMVSCQPRGVTKCVH